MNATNPCPHCGQPVSPPALGGLCPACMLRVGSAEPTDVPSEDAGPDSDPTPKPARVAPPPPAEIARHFPQLEILECLGRGGMGIVYKARQPKLNRLVALKLLAPEKRVDPRFAERFAREAQALARLNHPHIVTVYDFGEADGRFYLLMEYVDGRNLRELLRARRLAPEQALAIVPKMCEALQFAHERGIVHRDIKPENVLIDTQGRVKIADFGIAKLVGPADPPRTLTEDRQVVGTPHYMAPEQVERPQQVDHRADIYSLGVVFYEMLTGELPLGKFSPPSARAPVDARLDLVVLHALEKEPEHRYQHARDVQRDVQTIADGPAAPAASASVGGTAPSPRRSWALWYGFLVSLFGLPVGLAMGLPFVWGLAIVGIAVGGWKLAVRDAPGRAPPIPRRFRAVPSARWTARILGTLCIVCVVPFIVAEGLPPIARQPGGVQLAFAAGLLLFLGFLVGWWRDGTAAGLIASGWTLFNVSQNRFEWTLFHGTLGVAGLYAYCWWATHGRGTTRLAWAATGFALALASGRLFLPTSVQVRGHVTDATTGVAMPHAEPTLLARGAVEPEGTAGPQARADAVPLRVPPVVVRSEPAAGAVDVDPARAELRLTFSKPMRDGHWSCVKWSDATFPELAGAPRFLEDRRTCVLPVRLEPGRVYALWLNDPHHHEFQDLEAVPAVPYLLVFETGKAPPP